jgi:hypothetical protein
MTIKDAARLVVKKIKTPKSTAKINPVCDADKKLFDGVEYCIQASHDEHHMLWERWHYRADTTRSYVKNWEQVSLGHWLTIGSVDNRPICVSVQYAILNGHKVMFYEGTSQLVDYKMIEDWLERYFDRCNHHCNAANFHHCMEAVGCYDEARKKKANG